MAGLSQLAGNINLTLLTGDDFSWDMSFIGTDGTQLDLTNYTFEANVLPEPTTLIPVQTPIPITITETDLPSGRLHFYISKESVSGMVVSVNKHRWEFAWNYPNPDVPLDFFRRTVISGYFSLEDN